MSIFQKAFYKIIKHTPRTITEATEHVFDILEPGDIAIDCGANIGNVTEKMALHGVTVYAFEPNPHAYIALKRRFQDNALVHCIKKGVWDRESMQKLYLHKKNSENPLRWSSGSSLVEKKENISTDTYCIIEVIDLANFIAKLPKPVKLLKIDVEGVEYDILNAMIDRDIAQGIGSILVETHEAKIPGLGTKKKIVESKIKEKKLSNINLNWI